MGYLPKIGNYFQGLATITGKPETESPAFLLWLVSQLHLTQKRQYH